MQARRVSLILTYDNKDIAVDIAKFMKSFTFNDVMSESSDDIDITLSDTTEVWEGAWLPTKGAILDATIITHDWESDGDEQLKLGKFELDELEITGPPHEVKLKGVAIMSNNELRGVIRNRSWMWIKLSAIVNDIAKESNLTPFYDTTYDKLYKRTDQTDESNLDFLMKLCKDEGLSLKISDNKLIVFEESAYEKKAPIMTINKTSSRIISYNLRSKTREIYASCHVKYQHADKGKKIEYTFKIPKKEGKVLEINEKVESVAEAERLAKKKLREKNVEELTGGLSMVGTIKLPSGSVITLEGFHKFDGKYIVTKGSHDIGGNFSSKFDIRRVIDEY